MTEFVDITVRVRYADTDMMGIVYHTNHLIWFEMGRTEFLRHHGLSYKDLEDQEGCYLPVAKVTCTYHAPARYDDVLTVRTRIKKSHARLVVFSYELLSEDGRCLASAETTHVVTDRDAKPRRLPARYVEALRPATGPDSSRVSEQRATLDARNQMLVV